MTLYLVTGGAGFIGSNIVEELLRRGERVRVLDNFSTGRRENLAAFINQVELLEGDLQDPAVVHQAAAGVDVILHQAALPSVQRSVDDPLASNAANVTGTLNLLLAAREAGVKRLVYAASSSAYGDSPTLPKREDMLPQPRSPYAVSKLAGEHYCHAFSAVYGLETVCLRYFNVFGPRQDPASQYAAVIPLFIKTMLQGESPTIQGDGRQSRDFTYVSNVVQANLLAATAPGVAGRTFNIACGQRYTLLELIDILNDILGTRIEPTYTAPRPGDVRHSLADISAAREALGYHPEVDFEEGLRRTVDWTRGRTAPHQAAPAPRAKVLHVITRLIIGGAQENTMLTAAMLDPQQYAVDIVSGPQTGPEGSLIEEVRARGIPLTIEPSLVREIDPLQDLRALLALYRHMKRGGYTIVHTHSSKAGILGRLAARLAGVPVIVHTVHGWGHHDLQHPLVRWLYIVLERLVQPFTDRLVVVSERNTEKGLADGIAAPNRYVTIRSGIELDRFLQPARTREAVRAELGIPAEAPVIGTVTRLSPQKAPLDFLMAAARVAAHRPDVHFVIVGDGPLRAKVEARIGLLDLSDRMHLTGLRRDVPDLMHSFDIFALTSLWEGLPRVLPQAMAAGLPIVVTAVDGSAEAVIDSTSGLLTPPGDPDAMAAALLRLLEDPTLAVQMGEAGRVRAADFSAHKMVSDIAILYEALLEEHNARRSERAK